MLEAICTKQMHWFGDLCLRFQSISKDTPFKLLKLVSLFLSFPCFEISHFFFKIAYACQKRRALLLRRKQVCLGIQDFGLEFDHLPFKRGNISTTYHCLRQIVERLDRR